MTSDEELLATKLLQRPDMLERVLDSNPELLGRIVQTIGLKETALCSLLDRHPDLLEKYLEEHASPELISRLLRRYQERLLAVIPRSPSSPREPPEPPVYTRTPSRASLTVSEPPKRTSVTSELFHTWLNSSPIKRARSPNRPRASGEWRRQLGMLDEGELFMELIRDVSNELDIDVLCHKILVNVGLLTTPVDCSRPRASGEWRRQLGMLDEGELFMELIRDVSNELDIDVLCHKILVNVGLLTTPVDCSRPRASGEWRRQLGMLDEGELFMELIRDVSNELDIDVLCHKILVNVGLLTHADRGSLFLARGPPENRYLVAKLFDVTVDTELDEAVQKAKAEEIRIPFGVGVAGAVAQTKQPVNIKNAYEDPRFNCEIDMRTGYKTRLILCVPICNYEGDVIGVAQIINKTDDSNEFTERDVEVFQRYLTFCGISIQNAQLFEMSVQEYRRNQILLNLARSIFEEQNNLECLVTKIMTEARDLLKCERCAVFLLDSDCGEKSHLANIVERPGRVIAERKPLCRRESNNVNVEDIIAQKGEDKNIAFMTVFELKADSKDAVINRPTVSDLNHSRLAQIARYVAATGQILNIGDLSSWMNHEVKEEDGFVSRSVLCMPIVNGQKAVIGVAQLINKDTGQPFTDCDVSIFEAFAIFCGLGIHNTQMYENACKLMAKQKVALECLSYHATASSDDTVKLISDTIPSAETYKLYSFTFIDFDLTDDDTCKATIRMFLECNLVEQFHIPYDVLCRWVLSVKKNYRPVKYHNWRHALNVAQTMFAMLKTGKMERFMTDLEILGLLVACLCHDLDHRGTNNAFQTKTESPLAILYSTSTMEHHHFDQCVMILNSENNNIFQALSMQDYRYVMKVVENSILSTDLAMYFKKKNKFMELIENGEFDWQSEEKKELLCGMMMTACDVSAIAKPWEVQHKVAKLVADEFFDQGDLEKLQLNQQPVAMMDRERKDELPQMQVGFIDVICLPLYKVLADTFPWIQPLYDGCYTNKLHWQDLAEKVEMGLTWIDHDTIEKPVEEFDAYQDTKDIELTVQTLNCAHTDKKASIISSEADPVALSAGRKYNRFTSFRRSRVGKSVRSRLSRSMYNTSQSRSDDDKTPEPTEPVSERKPSKAPLPPPTHKTKNKLCALV